MHSIALAFQGFSFLQSWPNKHPENTVHLDSVDLVKVMPRQMVALYSTQAQVVKLAKMLKTAAIAESIYFNAQS